MLIDITGVELTPGNHGNDCLGNGEHFDKNGNPIECCCDECDFLRCCYIVNWSEKCNSCPVSECPRKQNK